MVIRKLILLFILALLLGGRSAAQVRVFPYEDTGLDAAKPASCTPPYFYNATDTAILYYCRLTTLTQAAAVTLKTNGSLNSSQTTLNVTQGSGITVADTGSGTIQISSTAGGGNVTTAPGAGVSQFIVQQSGTTAGANIFEKTRYVDSSWNWSFAPGGSYTGGVGATLTFNGGAPNNACPLGVNGSDPNLYVYISGGTGTAEPVIVTGGTCTPGLVGGTLTFTPVNSHSGAFTVASASTGGYEALRDCQATNNNNCHIIFPPTNPPNATFYSIYAPITVLGAHIDIEGPGATIDCEASRACFLMPNNNTGPVHIHGFRYSAKGLAVPGATRAAITNTACAANVATITSNLNPPIGTVVDIQQTFNSFYWGPHVVATTSGSSWTYTATGCSVASQATVGGNAYQWAFIETNGQGTQIDHITLDSPGGFLSGALNSDVVVLNDQSFHISDVQHNVGMAGCDANYCPQSVYAPGPFSPNAAVIYADHIGLSMFCTGNGFSTYNGNTVHISNTVIQGFSEWAVSTGTFRGGFGQTEVENAYTELGGCTNPNYPGSGLAKQAAAGMVVQGATGLGATIHGGEFPVGQIPQFAATGNQATTYNYWIIMHDGSSQTAPMKAGYAFVDSVTPTGSITVAWPRISGTTVTYDVLRTTGAGGGTVYPSNGGCPGGSTSACGSVATAQAQCSTAICTFTDTASANTSAVATPFPIAALIAPILNFWPGGLVLTSGASAKVEDMAFVTNVSPIVNTGGPQLPSVYASWCNGGTTGVWVVCPEGTSSGNNSPGVIGTLMQNGPQTGGQTANLKGRLNFMVPYAASVNAGHVITLVDSNPTKTLASAILRPSNDANDTFIGLDNGSVALVSAQLAFGSPVSISNYIGNVGDGSSYKERLTSALKTFTVPMTINSQITSSLATGTAPLVIASTTPVANLTASNHPLLQDCGSTSTCANTQKTAALIVRGSVAFPTATTVTVTSLPFTGAANYSCTASDVTTAAGVINATTYTSGSSVTFTETNGVNTDTMRYICVGF